MITRTRKPIAKPAPVEEQPAQAVKVKRTRTIVSRTNAEEQEFAKELVEELEAQAKARTTRTRSKPVAKPSPVPTEEPTIIKTVKVDEDGNEIHEGPLDATEVDKYARIINEYKAKATTPKRAIRSHCIECMGGMAAEVKRCVATECSLYPFRMGANPFHALAKGNKDDDDNDDQATNDRTDRAPASGEGHTSQPVRRARRVHTGGVR